MSTTQMAMCWPLQMPPTQKAVLISLADNANDHGDCWPSIPTICVRTCFSERAVHGAIKWLEDHGALRADRSNGRHTRYVVTADAYQPPQEMRPRSSCSPAGDAAEPPQLLHKPPQEMQSPPQQLRSNRKEPSIKATIKKQPTGKRASSVLPADLAFEFADCDPQKLADFLTVRKRKKLDLTRSAIDGLKREGAKAGLTLAAVVAVCADRGWGGYSADWAGALPGGKSRPQRPSAADDFRGKAYTGTPLDQIPAHLRPVDLDD